MFTYISIEEFADGVVKNNRDANRRELIVTGTYLCFTCTTGEADDSEDYEIE